MDSHSPRKSTVRFCTLCNKACRVTDKTFALKDDLLKAFQRCVSSNPLEESAVRILCDSCKRKLVTADTNKVSTRSKLTSLLHRGEISLFPAQSNRCRICQGQLKSSFFSVKHYVDVIESITLKKLSLAPPFSQRLCNPCKTLASKVASAEELSKELAQSFQRTAAARRKRLASTPTEAKALLCDRGSKRPSRTPFMSPTQSVKVKLDFAEATYRPIAVRTDQVTISQTTRVTSQRSVRFLEDEVSDEVHDIFISITIYDNGFNTGDHRSLLPSCRNQPS